MDPIAGTPRSKAASISVGVATPGMTVTERLVHQRTTLELRPGATMNCAPAATARSACAVLSTVPAPTSISGTCEREHQAFEMGMHQVSTRCMGMSPPDKPQPNG